MSTQAIPQTDTHLGLGALRLVRDLVALSKPRITLFVAITSAGGLELAARTGHAASRAAYVAALVGVCLIVSGANALNMFIERDIDRNMVRTQDRPLPSGRMQPRIALWTGVILSVLAVPVLGIFVNALTAFLAVLANLLYVFAYTPMKQKSHYSLLVGAVPGAIPPLLGWTAATGRLDAAGLVLFGILFLWQVPHFLAITLFRAQDYARAGLVVMPNVAPAEVVRRTMAHFSLALLLVSILLVPIGVAHMGYFVAASVLGIAFLALVSVGLFKDPGIRWAKQVFGASLVYIVAMMIALGAGL
jgi:heme o synthase